MENTTRLIDLRIFLIKLHDKTYTYKQLVKELDTIRRTNKLIPIEVTVSDIYEVGKKLGWFKDADFGRIRVHIR